MLMRNLPANGCDVLTSSDMCYSSICTGCARLVISCDCVCPKPPGVEVMIRYSTVLLDVYTTVATLNTELDIPISLIYATRT